MLDLFLTIAEITLAMTPILLIALLFTRFARGWSAGCRYAIWCVLLVRLAIPLNFSLPIPVIDLAPPAPAPVPQFTAAATPENYFVPPVSTDPNGLNFVYVTDSVPDTAYIEQTSPLPMADLPLDPTVVLSWMWLIGAAAVLAHTALTCFVSAGRLRRWKLPVTDSRLLDALERARTAIGLRQRVSLWICPRISSPMLHRLFRPEILLPHGDYTDDQLDAILRHELIHCRRGDLWWKLICMLATALHFFNPLVWIAQKKMEIEMEQSCDDAVFRLGDVSRQTYGETMLAVAREGLSASTGGLNTQFHASAKTLKARFANILDSSAKRAGVWLIVLALIVTVVCGGLVSCREEEPVDSDESAVIEAAKAAADHNWGFDTAYVSFEGDTATVSALHPSTTDTFRAVWADLTLTFTDGTWSVTDGLDGKLNIRSIEAEDSSRAARALKRTAEAEALIRTVWPGEDSLADYEAANHAYISAAELQANLEDERIQNRHLQNQLDTLSQRESMSAQKERNALEAALTQSRDRIAAIRDELTKRHQMLQATLPAPLQNAAYPLAGGAEQIDISVPAKSAEPGMELSCPVGTPVLAVADGIVIAAGYHPVDGHFVLIDHGEGGFTRTCWLSTVNVAEGDMVKRSHQIGLSGRSGHARGEGVRFVLSLGAHADPAEMLWLGADGIPTVPEVTTPPTTVTVTPETSTPIVTERIFSLTMPLLNGTYTTGIGFGWQEAYGSRIFHKGIAYPAEAGTPVFAAASGTVTAATYDYSLGNHVTIEHWDGFATTYAHLSKITYGIEPGVQIAKGTMIGQVGTTGDSTGNHLGFMLQKDGDYTDPAPYIHFPLRPVYTYTLSNALPRLHSWAQMTGLHLSSDTISRLGSEYTAVDYVIGQLYGDNHKFGQYTLRPEQITIGGKQMDSVWEIQYSSYESVLIAMQAGGGQMYFAEAVAPYRANAAVWYEIINGNTGSTLGKTSYTASTIQNAVPLFSETVWFVKNEQYDVKLTGVATAKLEVPVVYEAVAEQSIPFFTANMPLDGLMTRANRARITAEYETALGYLVKKYGEDHGYTALIRTTDVFENYESVWTAKKADGSSIVIAMKPGGESYCIGSEQSLTTGWFAAPRFKDSDPYGDIRLTASKAEPLLPCPITFPLPQVIDFNAENPVRYYAEDERFGPYDGWRYFGVKGEIQTVSIPARSTYTSQMYSSYVRNDIGRLWGGGRLPDSPSEVAQMMITLGTPFWQSMGRTPTAVTLKESKMMAAGSVSVCRAIYTLQESADHSADWIVYFLCEDSTVSAFAIRVNEFFDSILSMADIIIGTYRAA